MPEPVVIVGGGISGLSAAYYLNKAGVPVRLIERSARLGGVIATDMVDGCLVEGGPDSFLSAKPAAMELIREVGLEADVIGSNDHQRVTYIRRGGKLVPLPDGMMMMVPTRVMPMVGSGLLSLSTKIRMGLEWFRKPEEVAQDRSVAEFIREHYGQETVDYLAEPLLAGVYGGDPEKLSAASVLPRFVEFERKYGSLTRGTLAEMLQSGGKPMGAAQPAKPSIFRTLKHGMGSLVNAVEKRLDRTERITGEVEAVEEGRVRVRGEWVAASHVVVACPAHAAAKLLPIAELAGIPYSSSMTVALGFRREQLRSLPKGFGFLVPAKERKRLVACTFTGTKFAHRVPEGMELLRCFLGGSGDEAVLSLLDDQVVRVVLDELREICGLTAQPEFTRISRWPRSMAQYTVGHAARVKRINEAAAKTPWLQLAGNAYNGIGIPDCIALSKSVAESITAPPPI